MNASNSEPGLLTFASDVGIIEIVTTIWVVSCFLDFTWRSLKR